MKTDPGLDFVARYGKSVGLDVRPRTVLVEGTTDVELFQLAASLERARSGFELLSGNFNIVAAGVGDMGGAAGVARELLTLRGMSRTLMLPGGKPVYRFMALFDNDQAGRSTIKGIREMDTSIMEYRDVFRLWPAMPRPGNLDPAAVKSVYEKANDPFRGMDWEIEDFISGEMFEELASSASGSVVRTHERSGRIHRDLSRDGKARLHRLVKQFGVEADLVEVVETLKTLRVLMGLPISG